MVTETLIDTQIVDIPLLPLRDVVVYPPMVTPLFVGRGKSIESLERAMANDKQVLLVAQKNPQQDEPQGEDLYGVGTIASILQLLKLPDGTVKVLIEGRERAKIESVEDVGTHFKASVSLITSPEVESAEARALVASAIGQFEQYVHLSKKVPVEVITSLSGIDEPGRLADTIAAHMSLELPKKQSILEIADIPQRIEHLLDLMDAEVDLFHVEKKIRGRVKKQMEKSQREYYLNEQIKAIQKELGEEVSEVDEVDELEKKILSVSMPKDAEEKARTDLNKLKMMSPMSAEASVLRAYIDWMIKVPLSKRSKVRSDLTRAEEVLNKDHFGLEEVKERILEYLAVQQRVKKIKGPILCLVGPPGVGKTSLGESIARATNREFVRMALGGVRD